MKIASALITVLVVTAISCVAQDGHPISRAEAAQLSVYTPTPQLPHEARHRRLRGSGLFRLHIRTDTGGTTSVDIIKSTGSPALDRAAVQTLITWRIRPHTADAINVPVTFL